MDALVKIWQEYTFIVSIIIGHDRILVINLINVTELCSRSTCIATLKLENNACVSDSFALCWSTCNSSVRWNQFRIKNTNPIVWTSEPERLAHLGNRGDVVTV